MPRPVVLLCRIYLHIGAEYQRVVIQQHVAARGSCVRYVIVHRVY